MEEREWGMKGDERGMLDKSDKSDWSDKSD